MPSNIFFTLRKGTPFIYQTTHDLHYIGQAVFRACTPEECQLFQSYRKELDNIHRLSYTPNEDDVQQLIAALNQILERGNVVCTDTAIDNAQHEWHDFFLSLNEIEVENLNKQHEDFIEALDYKDGAFYRHDK